MIDDRKKEAEEMELLLPWYEKGTLSPADMSRVEAYLAANPDMTGALALIREEMTETIEANESLGMPRSAARDRLMEAIAAEAPRGKVSLSSMLRSLLPQGLSPSFAMGAAAAALVILVQAAAIGYLAFDGERGTRLATGDPAVVAEEGAFALVSFSNEATAAEIAEFLTSMDASIVDGPKNGGVFKIRLTERQISDAERDEILRNLREKSDIVRLVLPFR